MNLEEMRNKSQRPEHRWNGILLSLDPGHTTGFALWHCNSERVELLECGQWGTWVKDDLEMKDLSSLYKAVQVCHCVLETYQVYEWKSADHSWSQVPTIQVIGATKILCQQNGVSYSNQTAQVAKQFCDDRRLEQWGLYQRGLRHARDAIRHGAYYILFGNKKSA